jgi:hypothetical protein
MTEHVITTTLRELNERLERERNAVREQCRQQTLRQQQLAEREVTDLRAQVESLTVLTRLLGPARMVLDRCAETAPGCAAEAADMAQRIVDWIGHPVTDEPATAADLQAEVYRLQHLLYGDAGPDASDPDEGATCADVAVDGDPIRVHGQHPMSPAASEAVAAVIRATRAALAEHGPSDG